MYKCIKCGKEYKDLKNFAKSQSALYDGWSGHLPICRNCFVEVYDELCDKYKDENKALRRICMMFDINYKDKLIKPSELISHSAMLGKYLRTTNLSQNKGKTYEYNFLVDYADPIVIKNENGETVNQKDYEVPEEVIDRFGVGYSVEDYRFLQNEYNDWVTRHECRTKPQEEIFIRLSCKKLDIRKAEINGMDTKDLDKTYQDLLATANLQPKQMKNESNVEGRTLSTLIKEWEEYKPIEAEEEFKDVDHIAEYIDIFFKGGLAAGMGLKGNFFSNLYYKIMDKFTVKKPEIKEDDFNKDLYNQIFGDDYEE